MYGDALIAHIILFSAVDFYISTLMLKDRLELSTDLVPASNICQDKQESEVRVEIKIKEKSFKNYETNELMKLIKSTK